jgi:hypothetical protein
VRLTFIVWLKYLLYYRPMCCSGVPFAREYGGYLTTVLWRTLVSHFYAKGQTGQQLLLGAYSAMNRQMGRVKLQCTSVTKCLI